MPSVLFDAAVVLGSKEAVSDLAELGHCLEFLKDQCRHCRPILVFGEGANLLESAGILTVLSSGKPAGVEQPKVSCWRIEHVRPEAGFRHATCAREHYSCQPCATSIQPDPAKADERRPSAHRVGTC